MERVIKKYFKIVFMGILMKRVYVDDEHGKAFLKHMQRKYGEDNVKKVKVNKVKQKNETIESINEIEDNFLFDKYEALEEVELVFELVRKYNEAIDFLSKNSDERIFEHFFMYEGLGQEISRLEIELIERRRKRDETFIKDA